MLFPVYWTVYATARCIKGMSVTFYDVEPCDSLSLIVERYFVIEYDSDEWRTDYALPNGKPTFFYIECPDGLETKPFDSEQIIVIKTGFYVAYGKNLMEYSHNRMRMIGASVYPIFFNFLFKKPLVELINTFVALTDIPEFGAVSWPSHLEERPTFQIIHFMESLLMDRTARSDFSEELVEAYHKVLEPKGYMSTVEELAEWLGYSSRYMSKLFNKHLGMPPKQFLKIVRFNEAMKLMAEMDDNQTFANVAHEIGYHDQAHFIRDFKNICGRTPRELAVESESLTYKFFLTKSD